MASVRIIYEGEKPDYDKEIGQIEKWIETSSQLSEKVLSFLERELGENAVYPLRFPDEKILHQMGSGLMDPACPIWAIIADYIKLKKESLCNT